MKSKTKTNEKKPYLEQNISNHKLDRSDKKANTNTSPEIKISHNAEQATHCSYGPGISAPVKDDQHERVTSWA